MLTLQHFKTMRLIVGVLVVVFGLSFVFHALEAYGDGAAVKQKTVTTELVDRSSRTSSAHKKCTACNKVWRKVTTTYTTTKTKVTKAHYHFAQNGWSHQGTTQSVSRTDTESTSWAACTYVYPNGNKCGG